MFYENNRSSYIRTRIKTVITHILSFSEIAGFHISVLERFLRSWAPQNPATQLSPAALASLGANYKKILRLSYDVIITYDNRKSNLR